MLRSFLVNSFSHNEKTIIFSGLILDGLDADSEASFIIDNQLQRPDIQLIIEKMCVMPASLFKRWRTNKNLNFEEAIKQRVQGRIYLVDFRSPGKIEHIRKYIGMQDPYIGKISDMMKTYNIEPEDLQELCQEHFFVSSYKFLTPENKEDLLLLLQENKETLSTDK